MPHGTTANTPEAQHPPHTAASATTSITPPATPQSRPCPAGVALLAPVSFLINDLWPGKRHDQRRTAPVSQQTIRLDDGDAYQRGSPPLQARRNCSPWISGPRVRRAPTCHVCRPGTRSVDGRAPRGGRELREITYRTFADFEPCWRSSTSFAATAPAITHCRPAMSNSTGHGCAACRLTPRGRITYAATVPTRSRAACRWRRNLKGTR